MYYLDVYAQCMGGVGVLMVGCCWGPLLIILLILCAGVLFIILTKRAGV